MGERGEGEHGGVDVDESGEAEQVLHGVAGGMLREMKWDVFEPRAAEYAVEYVGIWGEATWATGSESKAKQCKTNSTHGPASSEARSIALGRPVLPLVKNTNAPAASAAVVLKRWARAGAGGR